MHFIAVLSRNILLKLINGLVNVFELHPGKTKVVCAKTVRRKVRMFLSPLGYTLCLKAKGGKVLNSPVFFQP